MTTLLQFPNGGTFIVDTMNTRNVNVLRDQFQQSLRGVALGPYDMYQYGNQLLMDGLLKS